MSNSDNDIVVSVLVITYNHEKFIAQALDSILGQKTRYTYEIVIGNDFSTDQTETICREYMGRHPKIIRLLDSRKNLGMQQNFIQTYEACKGKYIAILEGDDYWTDISKLDRQTDFLEKNEQYNICFTDYKTLNENTKSVVPARLKELLGGKDVFKRPDIIKRNIIATLTVVFRNHLIDGFPPFFNTIFPVDWPLHMLNSGEKFIKFLPGETAVYRIHDNGICSSAPPERNLLRYLEMNKNLRDSGLLGRENKGHLRVQEMNILMDYFKLLINSKRYGEAVKIAIRYLKCMVK